ncbi:MAG: hypothetical protein EZS28_051800, partial [Streblomastix strix]
GYTPSKSTIKYFWEVVNEMSSDEKRALLRFATGSPSLPAGGFSQLIGSTTNKISLFTLRQTKYLTHHHLPVAHTCFNVIDLPPYKSKKELQQKIEQALENMGGGFTLA